MGKQVIYYQDIWGIVRDIRVVYFDESYCTQLLSSELSSESANQLFSLYYLSQFEDFSILPKKNTYGTIHLGFNNTTANIKKYQEQLEQKLKSQITTEQFITYLAYVQSILNLNQWEKSILDKNIVEHMKASLNLKP